MSKYLLLLLPILAACSGSNDNLQNTGTFEPIVRSNLGPPHYVSAQIRITDNTGAIVGSTQTNLSTPGVALLPAGVYHWGLTAIQYSQRDSVWHPFSDTSSRTISITVGQVTHDTLVLCPMCM